MATLKGNELNIGVNDQVHDALFIANLARTHTPGEFLLTHVPIDSAYQTALN